MKKLFLLLLSCVVISITANPACAQGRVMLRPAGRQGLGALAGKGGAGAGVLPERTSIAQLLQELKRVDPESAAEWTKICETVERADRLADEAIAECQRLRNCLPFQVVVPGTGEMLNAPGARTTEEAKEMAVMLQHIQNKIQSAQQSLDEYNGHLARLERKPMDPAWWYEEKIRTARAHINSVSKEITEFEELFPRVTAAIEKGKSLAQVRNMVYGFAGDAKFYVLTPSARFIAAPGATTQRQAAKMQEYLMAAYSADAHGIRKIGYAKIENAIRVGGSLREIGLMVNPERVGKMGIDMPVEGRFRVVIPGSVRFHASPNNFKDGWVFTAEDYWYAESIAAPGALTETEAEQMQALLMQAYHERQTRVSLGSRLRGNDIRGNDKAIVGYEAVKEAIEQGKSLSEVRVIYDEYFPPIITYSSDIKY